MWRVIWKAVSGALWSRRTLIGIVAVGVIGVASYLGSYAIGEWQDRIIETTLAKEESRRLNEVVIALQKERELQEALRARQEALWADREKALIEAREAAEGRERIIYMPYEGEDENERTCIDTAAPDYIVDELLNYARSQNANR